MGQSFKAILQAIVLFGALAAIMGWLIDKVPPEVSWTLRISGMAAVLPAGWLLWRQSRKKDLVPDLLAQISPRYFERDGLHFLVAPAVAGNVCWLNVFYQNRYERPVSGRVVVQAPRKSFSLGRHPMPTVDVTFVCEGGGAGVTRVPWPIPANLQGKSVACEIAASSRYEAGRGRMLRFREGLRCGSPGGQALQTAATAGLLLVGVVSISKPATVSLRLPSGVVEQIPPHLQPTSETLYTADLPTGGFPVQPTQ